MRLFNSRDNIMSNGDLALIFLKPSFSLHDPKSSNCFGMKPDTRRKAILSAFARLFLRCLILSDNEIKDRALLGHQTTAPRESHLSMTPFFCIWSPYRSPS